MVKNLVIKVLYLPAYIQFGLWFFNILVGGLNTSLITLINEYRPGLCFYKATLELKIENRHEIYK